MPANKGTHWRPEGTFDHSLTAVQGGKQRYLGHMRDLRKTFPDHVVTDEQKKLWAKYWEANLSWWDDCIRQRARETWDHPMGQGQNGQDGLY